MLIDEFLKFERKNKCLQLKIQDIYFWNLIRVELYTELIMIKEQITISSKPSIYKNVLPLFLSKIKQSSNIWFNNPYSNLVQKDILIFNHSRRVKSNDLYECLYTSKLINYLEDNYYVYENLYLEKHFKPVPEKNIKYTDLIFNKYLTQRMTKKIFKRHHINKSESMKIMNLIRGINSEFNANLDETKWVNKIENRILAYTVYYQEYSKIIEKINPKVIIEVVSYSTTNFVINKIAREKGIPTIELQHGIMGKNHVAYNFEEKNEIDTYPEFIFTFGKYWKDTTRFPIKESKVIPVGWPFYEEKVKKQKELQSNITTILFISQGTVGKQLSKVAKNVMESLDVRNYKIIYKLHPGEYDSWKEDYPWLANTDIAVIDHNNYDMHYYFNQADIQIGVYSTAIFEGLGYNLKTYIIKLHGYENMKNLYENGYVTLIENSSDFLALLSNDQVSLEKIDSTYFWETNSLYNMLNEIDKIAGTKFSENYLLS